MRGWARQGVRIAAVAAAALALAGCFDLELTLKLNGDGSGRLSTRAILAKEWVNLGAHAKPPESKLLGAGRHVHRKSEIRNGQLVQEESTNFDNLSQLKGIEGGAIEVNLWAARSGARSARACAGCCTRRSARPRRLLPTRAFWTACWAGTH